MESDSPMCKSARSCVCQCDSTLCGVRLSTVLAREVFSRNYFRLCAVLFGAESDAYSEVVRLGGVEIGR